jgi:Flp pilus assembly protein CpaB
VSVFLIKQFVEVEKRNLQANAKANVEQVETGPVLVATTDISPAKPFDQLNYKIVQVPKVLIPETALSKPEDLEGKLSSVLIAKGDMILSSKASVPELLPRVSFMLEAGRRLVSVPVNEIATSGFVIKNGDYVDLVGNFPADKDLLGPQQELFGRVVAVTFLQRVKVVDIFKGEVTALPEADPNAKTAPKPGVTPGTQGGVGSQGKRLGEGTIATFDVTPEQAELVMGASRASAGAITLILRGFDDNVIREITNPLHQKIISGLKQEQTRSVASPAPVAAPPAPSRKKVL